MRIQRQFVQYRRDNRCVKCFAHLVCKIIFRLLGMMVQKFMDNGKYFYNYSIIQLLSLPYDQFCKIVKGNLCVLKTFQVLIFFNKFYRICLVQAFYLLRYFFLTNILRQVYKHHSFPPDFIIENFSTHAYHYNNYLPGNISRNTLNYIRELGMLLFKNVLVTLGTISK